MPFKRLLSSVGVIAALLLLPTAARLAPLPVAPSSPAMDAASPQSAGPDPAQRPDPAALSGTARSSELASVAERPDMPPDMPTDMGRRGRASCGWERELRFDPAAAPLHLGTETYPRTLALGDHEVVLTFDDGPSPDTTPAVLRALNDACVHATFFLIGRNAAAHPELARREAEEGHSVGHHSNSHPSFTLRGFDDASGERDIAEGIAADERAVYGAAASPDHPHAPFFRFPGFADSPALLRYLDRRGIAVFGADLWAADWLLMTPDAERRRVLGLLARRPNHNGVILFHDTKRATALMLPALLGDLRREGYRIVHLVAAPGAGAPALTTPRPGRSETETILARLRAPIVPGSHHLAGPSLTLADPPALLPARRR